MVNAAACSNQYILPPKRPAISTIAVPDACSRRFTLCLPTDRDLSKMCAEIQLSDLPRRTRMCRETARVGKYS